jgi:hypothetical protein
MDIVLSVRIIVAVAKVCIDAFNDSIQLNNEKKRIGNRIRYFVADIPLWTEHISTNSHDGLTGLLENVHDALKDIACSVQALNSDHASWNQKLKRRFTPNNVMAALLDSERRLNTALDDLGRYALAKEVLKDKVSIQDQDVSDQIQLALNDCYDSDEDENAAEDIDDTLSTTEKAPIGNGRLGHILKDNKYHIDFDLLHFGRDFKDRLGIGGFGEVFRGTYAGEIVAVKEVDIYQKFQKLSSMPLDEFQSECNRVCEETILL